MADCNENKEKQTPDMLKKAEEYLASKRRIFLWGGVDDESAERIVKQLLYLDSLNHDDIIFFINSPGGVISSGLAIYDCMNAIQSDVVTVCCGQAASMGAVLLTAGAKGKRCAWPNARIMIHQPLIHGEIVAPAISRSRPKKCCASVVSRARFLPKLLATRLNRLTAIPNAITSCLPKKPSLTVSWIKSRVSSNGPLEVP